MIKVTKPASIPTVIARRGVSETADNNTKYTNTSHEYDKGIRNFTIKGSIYNAPPVKRQLRAAQFQKCCFCEKPQGDEYGAVEHYRPKGGYRVKRGSTLIKPGYYWRGYAWDNLYFVCGLCNTQKGNIFPLRVEANRAKNHTMDFLLEDALLLDPTGVKNPRHHIKFDDQFIRGVTDEGKETIEICQLDRDSLNDDRAKIINEIEERIVIIIDDRDAGAVARAKIYLKNSIMEYAPFSAMTQDYISKSPIVIT